MGIDNYHHRGFRCTEDKVKYRKKKVEGDLEATAQ
jgi:hypothetical protein